MIAAFLLTLDDTDKRGDVIGTIRGAGSLLDLVEGRDVESSGGETWFNRYVIKPSVVPVGTPEIPCLAWVGINAGVPAVVRNEYSQNSVLWTTVEFRGYTPSATRAYMQTRLRQFAKDRPVFTGTGYASVTHIWEIVPGDVLTGNPLVHFVPLV